jgi:hypothetical protein
MPQRRRNIIVQKTDRLIVGGLEIEGETLASILNTEARVLWAFMRKDGTIQPVAFNEEHCIWLQDSDLERVDAT